MGHQVAAPIEVGQWFEWAAAALNQGSAIYEVGPASNAIEKALVDRLIAAIGFASKADGFATHGGTVGNLTALLAARNAALPSSWSEGNKSDAVLVAGADSHYSVTRAAGILGIGFENVVKVPLDEKRRMLPSALRSTLSDLRGRTVVAVVATSGSTSVGAFDPLEDLAEVCQKAGVWLHVDGAHGASILLSQKHRHLAQGIGKARSVVWDAHKLLGVAALCTFVLFQDFADSYRSFSQNAPYLFDPENPLEMDMAHRTLECTRRALAVPLWGLWSTKGEGFFASHIDALFARTAQFYELLREQADFKVIHEPECNILCFRYIPEGLNHETAERLNELQRQIRASLVKRGNFYITQTVLDGTRALRVTLMNPETSVSEQEGLLQEIRQAFSYL